MPANTVESAFVIIDRATGTVRSIKREVKDLRQEAEKAGVALDHLGAPREVAELRALAEQTQSLAHGIGDVREALGGPSGATAQLTRFGERVRAAGRDVDQFTIKVDRLGGSLERLRTMDVRPRVHVDGIVEARAELAALRRELRAFGASSPTATVGVRRGLTSSPVVSGGQLIPAGSGAAASGVRSVGLGPFSLRPSAGLALAGAGLPLAQGLLGGAGALGSTLGGAALGAGAVGGVGLGATVAGVGALMSVIKPATAGLKELAKAQDTYNKAVQDYGRRSLEAARARRELHQAENTAPAGGAALLRQGRGLQSDWNRLTRPGQAALTGAGASVLSRVRGVAPSLAGDANRVAGATGLAGRQLGAFATSPEQMLVMRLLTSEVARDMPAIERTTEHLVTTFGNVARAALPFLHDGVEFVDKWTGGWAKSTSDISATRGELRHWVDDFKVARDVVGDTLELARDLFSPGEVSGRGMLQDFDRTLQRWDTWAQRNPGVIREFFREGVSDTEKLAHFLGIVVTDLHQVAQVLDPIVGRFADLASIGQGTGLLLPAVLRAGAGKVVSGRGGGGGGGVVPIALGAGGGAAAAGASATTAAAAGAGLSYLALRSGGVAGRYSAGSTLSTPETFSERYGKYAVPSRFSKVPIAVGATSEATALGARYAMPEATFRPTMLGRVGGAIGTGAAAAGRFVAPVLIASGGIGALTTQGNALDRAQGFFHGVIPVGGGPITGAQYGSRGQQSALAAIGHLPAAGTIAQQRARVAALGQQMTSAQTQVDQGVGRYSLHASRPGSTGASVMGFLGFESRPIKDEADARLKTIKAEYAKENAALSDALHQRRVILNEQSREHGDSLADSLQSAFGIETKHGVSQKGALDDVLDHTVAKMRNMRPAGAKVLGEAMLGWADELAKKSPKLQGVVDDFVGKIEARFSKLGRHVSIVDGRILQGTASEWAGIAANISTPAEQALEKVTTAFTTIQQQAIGSLTTMGFTPAEAKKLVRGLESGSSSARQASKLAQSGQVYNAAIALGTRQGPMSPSATTTGGSLPGALPATGTGPFGDAIGDDRGFRAGTMSASAAAGGAGLMGADPDLAPYAALGAQFGSHVSSGRRAGAITVSGNVSYHSSGDAIDMTGGDMMGLARSLASQYGSGLEELIYSPLGWGIKDGRRVPNSFFGSDVIAQHYSHVHVADVDPRPGAGGLSFQFSPDTAGLGLQTIQLTAPGSGLGGVPGALADAASMMYAAGLSSALNAALGGGAVAPGGAGPAAPAGGGAFGFGQLESLWTQAGGPPGVAALMAHVAQAESGGRAGARNPSGASGLWQILGQPFGGNVFDPLTNARMAVAKYTTQGLGAWAASRPAWGRFAGDGPGMIRPRMTGARGPRAVVHVAPGSVVIHAHGADAAGIAREVDRQLGRTIKRAAELVASGPEEAD